MAADSNAIIAGRKTFFIQPDMNLFPENFCEEYLLHGYECYFANPPKLISLECYIDFLVDTFKDLILFFNIDAPEPGEPWSSFINKINTKYEHQVLIGVLYLKRQSKDEKAMLEKTYLFNIGIMCGCIQLEYTKKNNFGIIEQTLFANQANGRRKQVRAICNNNCTYNMVWNKAAHTGQLQDISISHFSIISPHGTLTMPLYEKIDGIQMTIKGAHVRTSAVLFMTRQINNGADDLMVFMFVRYSGQQGLDTTVEQTILPKLYEMMQENCNALLETSIRETLLK